MISLESRSNRFNLLPILKYTLSLACIAIVGHTIFVGMTLSVGMLKYSSIEPLSEKNEFVSTYDSMLNINLAEQSITVQDIIEERDAVKAEEDEKKEKDALATNSKLNGVDSHSDNMDIAYAAMLLAVNGTTVTTGIYAGNPSPGYPKYSDLYYKIHTMVKSSGVLPMSCDRSTVTPLKWCGAVDDKCPDGDVSDVRDYLVKSDKWVLVPKGEQLKPGDVCLYTRDLTGGNASHVYIYIGNDLMKKTIKGLINKNAKTVSGSLGQRGPFTTEEPWSKYAYAVITFRRIGSDRYTKYWDTGNELSWKNYWKKQ